MTILFASVLIFILVFSTHVLWTQYMAWKKEEENQTEDRNRCDSRCREYPMTPCPIHDKQEVDNGEV